MDCTAPRQRRPRYGLRKDRPPPPSVEDYVWGEISYAFSEPITDSDQRAEYAPTQVLSEVFKKMRCDGLKYRSLLGDGGVSFALFNIDNAKLLSCGLCTVTQIHHPDFSKERQVYYTKKSAKKKAKLV